MIITRTPFRISFFGGGTDIPSFFCEEGGQVLSTTIDKYCYVTARHLPPFFSHAFRIAYSRLETCRERSEIQHPLVRTILEDFDRKQGEIHYDADLPGNSGLGSSSSFGVGLTAAMYAMDGRIASKDALARKVIHYEREVLLESGGYQDQIAAAYGGFNHIRFFGQNEFSVQTLPVSLAKRNDMLSRMILCYIPKERFSANVSVARAIDRESYRVNLRWIRDSVDTGLKILQDGDLDDFGRLLHEAWQRKREFAGVTDADIDAAYDRAMAAGALGGKLLGAGGGGFMLLWTRPQDRDRIAAQMSPLLRVPFAFETEGVQVIYYREFP
jgi:D-glycero-alpha-D-manno-heptose-7-phosphate kinase